MDIPMDDFPTGFRRATFSTQGGSATAIFHATVTLRERGDIQPFALHEGGHVLGLDHSPRQEDLMYFTVTHQRDFSDAELAVLTWIYGR